MAFNFPPSQAIYQSNEMRRRLLRLFAIHSLSHSLVHPRRECEVMSDHDFRRRVHAKHDKVWQLHLVSGPFSLEEYSEPCKRQHSTKLAPFKQLFLVGNLSPSASPHTQSVPSSALVQSLRSRLNASKPSHVPCAFSGSFGD